MLRQAPFTAVLDQGGHSTRLLVYDQQLQLILEKRERITTSIAGRKVTQSIKSLMRGLDHLLQELKDFTDEDKLVDVIVLAQRSSFVACKKSDGNAITDVISWQDTRGAELLDALKLDVERVQSITGLRANAHYGASKMTQLLGDCDEVRAAAVVNDLVFVPLASFLWRYISGNKNFVLEPGVACRTLLFDCHRLRWSNELLDTFDIKASQLPELGTTTGVQSIKGLAENCTLVMSGGDQSFLSFAFPKTFNAPLFINLGTGAFIQSIAPHDGKGLLTSLLAVANNKAYVMSEGTVNNAAGAIEAFLQREKREWDNALLNRVLSRSDTTSMVHIDREIAGGSPYWLPAGSSRFDGQGDFDDKLEAVINTLVFSLYLNYQSLQGAEHDGIWVSGGLSHVDGICQRIADVFDMPVNRCHDAEASARGAVCFYRQVEPDVSFQTFVPESAGCQKIEQLKKLYKRWHQQMLKTLEL